jgi:serine/arginine repetitive matrix protein 2
MQRDPHRSIAQVASPSAPIPSTSTVTSTVRRVTMPPKDEVIYLPSDPETEIQAVASNLLALPPPTFRTNGGGSIATRAIRSMQSLARMASWAQLKGDGQGSVRDARSKSQAKEKDPEKEKKTKKPIGGEQKVKTKSKDKEIGPPKRKKKTMEDKDKARVVTVRASTSSFEAGALTASPERGKAMSGPRSTDLRSGPDAGAALGLPPSMRLPAARDGGSTSSVSVCPQSHSGMRLAVDGHPARVRPGSAMSTASSMRPLSSECSPRSKMSTESGGSAMNVSVRWNEDGLEKRKKERETNEKQRSAVSAMGAESVRGSGRLSDGRKRAPLSGVFPAAHVPPIVTVEEASSDGHGSPEPPPLRRRPRPVSDLPLGRSRATSIREETEGEPLSS